MSKAGVGYTSLPISALLQAQRSASLPEASPASQVASMAQSMASSVDPLVVRQFAPAEQGPASIHDKLDLARERQRAAALAEARQASHRFDAGDLGACMIRSVSNGESSSIPIVDLDQLQLHASPAMKTKELLRQFAPTLTAELRVIVAGKHSFGTQQYCVAVAPLAAALDQAIALRLATPVCERLADWLRGTFPVDFPPPVAVQPVAHPAPAPVAGIDAAPVHGVPVEPIRPDDTKPSAQVSALFPKLAASPCTASPWARNETLPAATLLESPSVNPMLRVLMDRFVLEKRKGDVFIELRQLDAQVGAAACCFVEPATCALAPDLLAALVTARRSSGQEVTIIHPAEDHDDAGFWQGFDGAA